MELSHISFQGPAIEPSAPVVAHLPANLVGLLTQVNGFVQFEGGLHVRGVCSEPTWHSLAEHMMGPHALHHSYPAVEPADVPFAQDCMADQFLLREGVVYKLQAETGEIECLNLSLPEFFDAVEVNPFEFLAMQPLLRFKQEGGTLEPGQVLHAYPPFCTKEAEAGVSLKAIAATEAIAFLSTFSRQMRDLAEGQQIKITVVR